MEQKALSELTNLCTAANRLLEFVTPTTPRTCASDIHKTVRNLMFEVNDILSEQVTLRLAEKLKISGAGNPAVPVVEVEVPAAAPGSVTLTAEQVLHANIGLLGLPMRLEMPLQKAGLRKIRDLCGVALDTIRDVDGVGSPGLDTIMEALELFDISLTE